MTADGGDIDLLSQGPEREPGPPLFGGWRPGPWVVALAAAVVIVGAGAVVLAKYLLAAPHVPDVRLLSLVSEPSSGSDPALSDPPWLTGVDRRPSTNVRLELSVIVSATGSGADPSSIVGLRGPGVVAVTEKPVPLQRQRSTKTTLVVHFDCRKVPIPVRVQSYAVVIRAVSGSRTDSSNLPLRGIDPRWAPALEQACGSWLAREDVTLVSATSSVDPSRPAADLAVTLQNAGRLPAYIALGWGFGGLSATDGHTDEAMVPAGRKSTLHVHVEISDCSVVPASFSDFGGGPPLSTDVLGLVALVGSKPGQPGPDGVGVDGRGPTGLRLMGSAADDVGAALRAACGDLNPFVTLLAHGGATVGRGRVLRLHVLIDGTPGKVADVTLISDPALDDPTPYVPLWSSLPGLKPDANGQIQAVLTYRIPAGSSGCPSEGFGLPGFTLVARAHVGSLVKEFSFREYVNLFDEPAVLSQLCPVQ